MDALSVSSKKVDDFVGTKLANIGGALYFGAATVNDLFSILNQDSSSLAELPFDASMALRLATNASLGGKSLKDSYGDAKNTLDRVVGLFPRN